jgi:hypothetical protein
MRRARVTLGAVVSAVVWWALPARNAHAQSGAPVEPLVLSEKPKLSAIELSVHAAFARTLTARPNVNREIESTPGGPHVAVSVLYRSRYFLSPFVDVSTTRLYASRERVDIGSAGGIVVSDNRLRANGAVVGAALDLARLRLQAGLGVYQLAVTSTVLGRTIRPKELAMGYLFALSGAFLRTERARLALEMRVGVIDEAATHFVTFGVTGAFDAVQF